MIFQSKTSQLSIHRVMKGTILFLFVIAISILCYAALYSFILPQEWLKSTSNWNQWIIQTCITGVVAIPLLWIFVIRPLEHAAKKEHQFTSTILNSFVDAVIITNARGEIEEVNPAALKMFGYLEEELIGLHIRKLVTSGVNTCQSQQIEAVRKIGEFSIVGIKKEINLFRKDGQDFQAELAVNQLDGNQRKFVALISDVTEAKRKANVFHSIVEATSRSSGESFFPLVSQHLAEAFGADHAFVSELNSVDISKASTLAVWSHGKIIDNIKYTLGGTPCDVALDREYCFVGENVQEHFPDDLILKEMNCESYLAVRLDDQDGNPMGLMGVMHGKRMYEHPEDSQVLSLFAARASVELERKQFIERLSQEKIEAEAATQSKSDFLANMSHEIRTPMTAILGFTDQLSDLSISELDRRAAIHTIHRNGKHLLSVINDILDLSKIEAGKLEIENVQCSPIQIAQEVIDSMQGKTSSKPIDIELEFATPVPETITSDPTRLRQILMNLMGNAFKFTERGMVYLKNKLH
ncbi:MAG: PAS domain S-box protein [Pirellulales bacterium]